ncbi:MAG: TnpV protein [Clostridium fessum]
MKAAGVTEELKAANQKKWVGLVNNCKAQVEEIIQNELIFR